MNCSTLSFDEVVLSLTVLLQLRLSRGTGLLFYFYSEILKKNNGLLK